MPYIRFWRRITIFPGVRLNFSKSGVSITFGKRGFGITIGKRGIRFTAGIPGSGLYMTEHINYKKIKKKLDIDNNEIEKDKKFLKGLSSNAREEKK